MKAVIVAAMLMACAVATPLEEHQRMFADFKSAHGRKYASEEEELKRFRVFSDNMKRAEELSRANPLARFGSNVFADLTAAEFKSRHNADVTRVPKSKSAPISFGASAVRDATRQAIDWRTKGAVTPVKDQGDCGSCWAFSTTGSIEGQWYLAGNPLTALSEQELVSCDGVDRGCDGGLVSAAVDWLVFASNGQIVTEAAYPYSSGTNGGFAGNCSANLASMSVGAVVSGQRDVSHDENQMAAFVYTTGPLSILVDATQWQFYNGGIMSNCLTTGSVDHAVLITGFNDTEGSWTIKNSWGAHWGEAGYIRVQKGTNQCQLTKLPTTSIVGSIVPPPAPTTTTPPTPPTTPPPRGSCNANLPAATFNFPQMYNGNSESFDWLVSLTTPSTNTPAGDPACASGVYIGQYTPGSSDPAACITAAPFKSVQSDGCLYTFTQTDGSTTRIFAVTVKCDRSATTLTPPTAFVVTTVFGQSWKYTGTFTSAAVC